MFDKQLNDLDFVKRCIIRTIYIALNIEKLEIFKQQMITMGI